MVRSERIRGNLMVAVTEGCGLLCDIESKSTKLANTSRSCVRTSFIFTRPIGCGVCAGLRSVCLAESILRH